MTKKYFGTDGIRGQVGEKPITPEFFMHIGWAIGRTLAQEGSENQFLIGKDTRISGYMFESALQAGFIAAGVNPLLLGPMPTPAVSYLTHTFNARAGVVISASHNGHSDNGIKIFDEQGYKLSHDIERQIEEHLEIPFKSVLSEHLGRASRINDAVGRYIEYCKGTIDRETSLKDMRIVLDCANGATYQVAPKVFKELGAKVDVIAAEPDGLNINLDCGSTRPSLLQAKVLSTKADMGIAFDGDGDRVLFVDHKGEQLDGDEILFILADSLHQRNKLRGVVGTEMTNLGFEKAVKSFNINFERTQVGDRHVIERMRKNDWNLGGESSGHIILGDIGTTGDGIVGALQVIQALQHLNSSLNEAKNNFGKLPQVLLNVRVKNKNKVMKDKGLKEKIQQCEQQLEEGRILVRPSGTERLIRVMIESNNVKKANTMVKDVVAYIENLSA